jgi:hypothetical protein
MPKRKLQSTSLNAYKSLDPENIRQMYKDIVFVLGQMQGGGSYEDIAKALKVKESRVWKRLGEAERIGLIHRSGRKILSSGRAGSIWKVGPKGASLVIENKGLPGPSVSDYAKAILQTSLF